MKSKIGKFKMSRRGVSPIIATLLLVAIAVAAAVVTYTWVISMTNNQATKSQTQISIDQVMFGEMTGPKYGVFLSVRNGGSVAATIDTVYLFKGDALVFQYKLGTNLVIPVGSTVSLDIKESTATYATLTSGGQALPATGSNDFSLAGSFQGGLTLNSAYQLQVMTNNGFQAAGTYYTPGAW